MYFTVLYHKQTQTARFPFSHSVEKHKTVRSDSWNLLSILHMDVKNHSAKTLYDSL